MPTLYLITGPAGVGKSTLSQALAESLEKSVLIEGDSIYHLVIGSYVSAWKEGNHLPFFWENSLLLIENSLKHGYDVIFNYIFSYEDLVFLQEKLHDYPIRLTVLMTTEEELLRRDQLRPEDCRMNERCLVLLHHFEEAGFSPKNYLDTTTLSIEETLSTILSSDDFYL